MVTVQDARLTDMLPRRNYSRLVVELPVLSAVVDVIGQINHLYASYYKQIKDNTMGVRRARCGSMLCGRLPQQQRSDMDGRNFQSHKAF
jgi:hypothetical protein